MTQDTARPTEETDRGADTPQTGAGSDGAVDDERRLAALRRSGLLDHPPREAFDRLTRLAATILHAPVALVSLVDVDRQVFVSCLGLPEPVASEGETPLSHSFCRHTVASREPLIVGDAREHPLVRDNPAIVDLNVVAYAGIPLITSDGDVLGSFCVIDHQPRRWTEQDIALLTDLAGAVMTEIGLQETARVATARAAELEAVTRERRRLEQAMIARTGEMDALVEAMEDGVITYDTTGRKLRQNRAARAIFGLGAQPDYDDLPIDERSARLDVRDGEGHPLPAAQLPAVRVVRGQVLTGADAVDLRFTSLDGRSVEVNATGAPVRDDAGRVVGGVVVYRDVTERRGLERVVAADRDRLRQILDVLPTAVLICDAASGAAPRFVRCNWAARELMGGDVTGLPVPLTEDEALEVSSAWYPDGRPYAMTDLPLQRAVLRGEEVVAEQVVLRQPVTGRAVPILANAAPLCDDEGAIIGAVAVFQDITALKDLEQARDAFLSSVSHDLKTPLTSILGYAQLARRRLARLEGVETMAIGENIRSIEGSAMRMLALVNDLLELTRSQMGAALPLDLQPSDLAALARRIVADLHIPATHHVVVEAPPALVVAIDPDRIERVLGNLLSNALKYSPGGGTVTVRVAREESPEGLRAIVSVHDEGIGIATADLARIFERFHRGANVVGRIEGTGVGLASAQQIVAAHGGTLGVESAEGAGSTFTMRLPLAPG